MNLNDDALTKVKLQKKKIPLIAMYNAYEKRDVCLKSPHWFCSMRTDATGNFIGVVDSFVAFGCIC